MKRLVLLILLCAAPAFAQGPVGGATASPPMPDQSGVNLVANPSFATSLASWTANACATFDATTTHTADGSGSAKIACTAGGTISVLLQTVTVGTNQEGELLTLWVKTDAAFNGTFVLNNFFDNTHGSGSRLAAIGRTSQQINAGSTSWVQLGIEVFPNEFLHAGDLLNFRINVVGQTAGTAWMDDVSVADEWFPIRNFVTSTQANGSFGRTKLRKSATTEASARRSM